MAIKRVKRSRMMIRADMLNKGLTICFKDIRTRRCFCYPVDEFFNWLSDNTECLETNSWKKGLYNWAYVPKRYFALMLLIFLYSSSTNQGTSATSSTTVISSTNVIPGICFANAVLLTSRLSL